MKPQLHHLIAWEELEQIKCGYTLHSKSISLVNEAVVNFNVGLVYCGNIGYL